MTFIFSTLLKCTVLITFLLVSTVVAGFSQRTYEKGYIVSASHDTLRGFIDYKNWDISPAEIAFKNFLNAEEKTYTAKDILTFFIEKNKEVYDAHSLSFIPVQPEVVYKQLPFIREEKNVFLQRLWDNGTVFLYVANISEGHKNRFWVKKKGVMTELIHYTFRRYLNNTIYESTISEYAEQLNELTNDAPGFSEPKPSYTATALINYFRNYNRVLGGVTEYIPMQEKATWYIGLSGGLENFNFYNYKKETNPALVASIRVHMPRNFHKAFIKASYSITTGLSIWDYKNEAYVDHKMKSFEVSAGHYIGHAAVQPFWSIGLGIYTLNYETSGVLFPSVGISYKKKIELEITRFMDLLVPVTIEDRKLLLPPRISLSYHFKL